MATPTKARLVIAGLVAGVSLEVNVARAQEPEPILEREAYSIYSELIPKAWPVQGELVLQRETAIDALCSAWVPPDDPEWAAASKDFGEQNTRPRLLRPELLSMVVPYRLIARSEIEADDARLALKYPERWQRRPELKEFVAVSAIGFNLARTKAIVYVRSRSKGGVSFLERRDGQWVRTTYGGCGWIA